MASALLAVPGMFFHGAHHRRMARRRYASISWRILARWLIQTAAVQTAAPTQARSNSTFRHGVVIQGTAYGLGSGATTDAAAGSLYTLPFQSAYVSFLKPVPDRLPFVCRRRLFSGTTAEVHRRVLSYWMSLRLPSLASATAGRGIFLFGERCFSRRCRSRDVVHKARILKGLFADNGIKRFTARSVIQQPAWAIASRYL